MAFATQINCHNGMYEFFVFFVICLKYAIYNFFKNFGMVIERDIESNLILKIIFNNKKIGG